MTKLDRLPPRQVQQAMGTLPKRPDDMMNRNSTPKQMTGRRKGCKAPAYKNAKPAKPARRTQGK